MTKPETENPLAYRSPEEFARVCRVLGDRLHYLNRVAIGESKFAWEVASAIKNLGKALDARLKDPEVARAFGNGWEAGTMTKEEKHAFLAQLIFDDPRAPVPERHEDGNP